MKQATAKCCLAVSTLGVKNASAKPPVIQSPSPIIYLADNLDEADGLGWCIDTVGRGLSDSLHAHSCKPQGGDVQFRHDTVTGQIVSVTYETRCAEHAGRSEPLALVDCDVNSAAQTFAYDVAKMTFHPENAPDLCLTISGGSRSAGPFMSRGLLMQDCDAAASMHQTWVIKP